MTVKDQLERRLSILENQAVKPDENDPRYWPDEKIEAAAREILERRPPEEDDELTAKCRVIMARREAGA